MFFWMQGVRRGSWAGIRALANDGILRLGGDPTGRSLFEEVFDRSAFEERLSEARARRAIVLAGRGAPRPPGGVAGDPVAPRAGRMARPEPILAPSEIEIAAPQESGSTWRLAAVFLSGMAVGSGITALLTLEGRAPEMAEVAPAAVPRAQAAVPILAVEEMPWVPMQASLPDLDVASPPPEVRDTPKPPVEEAAAVAAPAVVEARPMSERLAGRPYPRPVPAAGQPVSPEAILSAMRETVPAN